MRAPAHYWREVQQHLGFVWRSSPRALRATGDDPAFAQWFPGGRLNFVDSIFQHARGTLANTPALVAQDEAGQVHTVSYSQIPQRVLAIASGLRSLGITAGDRIGLMMPMNAQAVLSLLAIAALGAVAVPLFSGFAAGAAAARLQMAQARLLIAGSAYVRRGREVRLDDTLTSIRDAVPGIRFVVDGATAVADVTPWEAVAAASPALAEPHDCAATDPFMIVFTSGTTASPKARCIRMGASR